MGINEKNVLIESSTQLETGIETTRRKVGIWKLKWRKFPKKEILNIDKLLLFKERTNKS